MTSLNSKPLASAILATYNSDKSIVPAISSLLTQTVEIEIIVVDDGSTDKTSEILKQFPSLICLNQSHQGPAKARNLGAAHTNSEILLFVDADMTFAPDYVETLIKPILNNEANGTYSVRELVAKWVSPLARGWNIQEGWTDRLRFPPKPPKYGTHSTTILN